MICEHWFEKDKNGGGRSLIGLIFRNLFGVNDENKETFFGVTDVPADITYEADATRMQV
jgi:hypothetical protein